MTRIIEHRQDARPGEEVSELRVFQLRDGDVRACVVPADLAVNLDMMADMSEPVAQAYLDALALCETKVLRPYGFTIRSVSFPARSTGVGTVMNQLIAALCSHAPALVAASVTLGGKCRARGKWCTYLQVHFDRRSGFATADRR